MNLMNVKGCGVFQPKDGLTAEECEDAFAGDATAGRFAIADGATEGCFSGSWARLLVDEFLVTPIDDLTVGAWVEIARKKWGQTVDPLIVPWYIEVKRQTGAFATFLGVAVDPTGWQAFAVGDCCLVHLSGDDVRRAFPIETAVVFDNIPDLIPSRPDPTSPGIATAASGYDSGDWLFLMTDALAAWALKQWEAGRPMWNQLRTCISAANPAEAFAENVPGWRVGGMRNDDVTLLAVRL